MTSLLLFFVGAALFVNGLALLGHVQPNAAAPVNALIGVLLIGVTLYLVLPLKDMSTAADQNVAIGAVGFLLFAITHLTLAHNFWTGCTGCGLGWYCLWAAGVSGMLSAVNFIRFDDPRFGTLWLLWGTLFGCFFAISALERQELVWGVGWITTIHGFLTTTIPGALLLLGSWGSVSTVVALSTGAIALLVFGALLQRSAVRLGPVESLAADAADVRLSSAASARAGVTGG